MGFEAKVREFYDAAAECYEHVSGARFVGVTKVGRFVAAKPA